MRLRRSARRDRGSGCGVDVQLLPHEEPLRPRGRRPRRGERRRARRADPDAPLPRVKAKRVFEYIGTNSRLDEIQAAALRIFLRELTAGQHFAARRPSATHLGLGELCEVPEDEPGHVYHLFVSLAAADEIRAALTEAGIGSADYYEPRSISSLRSAISGTPRATFPRPSARPENFSVPLWARIAAEQQERVVDTCARGARRARVGHPVAMRSPVNRHRLWQVGVDALLVVAAWTLAWYVRFDGDTSPVYYDRYLDWDVFVSFSRSSCRCSSRSASTTAGGATSRRRTCGGWYEASRRRPSPRSSSSRCSTSTPPASRAASGSSTSSSCSPSSRALACSLAR